MALRTTPHGEDPLKGIRGQPVSFSQPGTPPGEDGTTRSGEIENEAQQYAQDPEGVAPALGAPPPIDFLSLVKTCEQQAQLYMAQVNRRAWAQSYRAIHNEHYVGSKYTKPEWRNRSRLFVPKTKSALRKDMAAVAASLFNTLDAITCLPGDESDELQRASAAIKQELLNYRMDRTSGKASMPWFLIAMGSRMNATVAGICLSKQYWKQEFRKVKSEQYQDEDEGIIKHRDVFALEVDRPDIAVFPPENFVIHPGANWLNPAQSAAYIILKYPMTLDEIKDKQEAPINPWKKLTDTEIMGSANAGKQDMGAIRRAREGGLDRFDETQTGTEFQIVWVYETFMRVGGEDWNFWSVGSEHYLTDPKPVREAYPEQFGERPISFGYGQLEADRIFPMSAVESWQPLQVETNDLRNLQLDAIKQNVMPVTKVVRGKRVDLDQVRRRSSGSTIFVDEPTDVTFEQPPQMGEAPIEMSRELGIELDDLSGQQNYGSVEDNNAVGKTLGGLKLAAGAANAVQEFDIRVWIETWCEPTLAQVVRLEEYYESDPVVLGLCGKRAQLMQKHGVDKITDELLEEQVTVRVSIGLGAGDPAQRLGKFQQAASVAGPLLAQTKEFQSGQVELNWEEVLNEIFGAVGYKDGGMRFVKVNQGPAPNPTADLQTQKLQSEIQKNDRMGKAAIFTGLANVAKVSLGQKDLEAQVVDMLLGHQGDAQERGFAHAQQHHNTILSAMDHGSRHAHAINDHRRNLVNDAHSRAMAAQEAAAAQQDGEGADDGGAEPDQSAAPAPGSAPSTPSPAPSPADIEFVRHPQTGRIVGARLHQAAPQPAAQPKRPKQPAKAAKSSNNDALQERLAALEASLQELRKPRKRKVVRDENGRVTHVEDEAT
jgi:hypothetical protein